MAGIVASVLGGACSVFPDAVEQPGGGADGAAGGGEAGGPASGGAAGAAASGAAGGDAGTGGAAASGGEGGGGNASGGGGGTAGVAGASGAAGTEVAGAAGAGGTAGASGAGGAAGTAGTAGVGGSGGDGGPCDTQDDDGDTVSECQGDCDDSDPTSYQGNQEICGDFHDNDCDDLNDENCQGLGTFVSSVIGDDSNPGTVDEPVKSIQKGIEHAQTIGGGVDVWVGQGNYTEKITMVETIDLIGGLECTAKPCSWKFDPSSYLTNLYAVDAVGVLAGPSITIQTRLEGFEVHGLDGAAPALPSPGRAAITLAAGSPVISRCNVYAPDVTGSAAVTGRSIGILVQPPTNDPSGPIILGNGIYGGSSQLLTAAVLLDKPPGTGATYAKLWGNLITGGSAPQSYGVFALSGSVIEMLGNVVETGTAAPGPAWGVRVASEATLSKNWINTGNSSATHCTTSAEWCGGVRSSSSRSTIENNVIVGVNAPLSAALVLSQQEVPAREVHVNANTLIGGGNSSPTARSTALLLGNLGCAGCDANVLLGLIRNNVLAAGRATSRHAIYEYPGPGYTTHPEVLENNLLNEAPGAGSAALYHLWNGSVPTGLTTIAEVNGLDTQIPGLTAAANLSGDPLLSPDYHIPATSPCVDQGTLTDAPSDDFDSEVRPMGSAVDIGADELLQ